MFLTGDRDGARAVLSACQFYARQGALLSCTRDFTHEFDWSALIEGQVLSQDGTPWSRFGAFVATEYRHTAKGANAACRANADCRQQLFFGGLKADLVAACGPLPAQKKRTGQLLSAYLAKP